MISNTLNKFKAYLESIHITPASWLAGISGVLMVRFFLESLSNPTSTGFFASDASTLIHYYLFFLSLFVVFMIFFELAIPEWKVFSSKIIAIFSAFVWIGPIIDFIASKGNGFRMTYFFDSPKDFVSRFLTFGGTDLQNGATIGLRVEIALILVLFGFFVWVTTKNWKRALMFPTILYTSIIVFALIPSLVSVLFQSNFIHKTPILFLADSMASSSTLTNNIHNSLQYSSAIRLFEVSFNFIMGKILFIILFFVSSIWFFKNYPDKFKAIIKNLRPERTIHYLLLIGLGLFIASSFSSNLKLNWNDWLSVLILFMAFVFSILFAICSNDIVDVDTDKISAPNRPLISMTLTRQDMRQFGMVSIIMALVAGFLAGYTALFFVLTFTALYYVYSVPPTRFKLVPFFSSFIIGLCSLAAVLSGFYLLSPTKKVSDFPASLAMGVVLIFFLGSHIRDIKDMDGDKMAGIRTVPVIFGEKWGPKIVGIFAASAFLLVPVVLNIYILFLTAIPGAFLAYYFSMRKPYSEKFIFLTYFTFVFISFLLIHF